jgi:hypothetical protein
LLRAWSDAPAFLLSCPGPLRRHHASLLPISQLSLPQCLLGAEAQLSAFAASQPEHASRTFFTPLPEIFGNGRNLDRIRLLCGLPEDGPRPVHLRFGGTRSARVMKDARNAMVLAENHLAPATTSSNHPFADGLTLPASMRRVYATGPLALAPVAFGGETLPVIELPPDMLVADLGGAAAPHGLEIASLAEFRSNAFAAGPLRAGSADLRAAELAAARDAGPFVLLPWNLDHPGSTVPALVARTLQLQSPDHPAIRLVLMAFNYAGPAGLIRRLIRDIREDLPSGPAHLRTIFLARVNHLGAVPALRRLARVAWVDGNDPEHDWTLRRLAACGFSPLLLAADAVPPPPGATAIPADEAMTVDAETRFGTLSFRTHLPSLRALRQLLPLTRSLAAEPAPPPAGAPCPPPAPAGALGLPPAPAGALGKLISKARKRGA